MKQGQFNNVMSNIVKMQSSSDLVKFLEVQVQAESSPWNFGSNWITPGLTSKFLALAGNDMQEGVLFLVGCK